MPLLRLLAPALLALTACAFGDDRTPGGDVADAAGGDAPAADAAPTPDASPSPDAAPSPDAEPTACTLVPQAGCPAGDAFDVASVAGDTGCRSVDHPGRAADACDVPQDCAAGHTCIAVAEDAASCMAFCDDDDDCVGDGSLCVVTVEYDGAPIPGVALCSQACAPTTSAGCPPGWACRLFTDDADRDHTRCAPAGVRARGAACTGSLGCQAGLTCLNHDAGPTCEPWCVRGAAGACAAFPGTTCRAFSDPYVIGAVEYGVCF